MKKFLLLGLIAVLSFGYVNSQSAPLKAKTITGVDTITFANVPGKIKSFQYTYTKTSGTGAGKIILEGTNDTGGGWVGIDSVTLTNTADKMVLKTNITSTNCLSYRYRNTNTSAATFSIRAVYLRRTDE